MENVMPGTEVNPEALLNVAQKLASSHGEALNRQQSNLDAAHIPESAIPEQWKNGPRSIELEAIVNELSARLQNRRAENQALSEGLVKTAYDYTRNDQNVAAGISALTGGQRHDNSTPPAMPHFSEHTFANAFNAASSIPPNQKVEWIHHMLDQLRSRLTEFFPGWPETDKEVREWTKPPEPFYNSGDFAARIAHEAPQAATVHSQLINNDLNPNWAAASATSFANAASQHQQAGTEDGALGNEIRAVNYARGDSLGRAIAIFGIVIGILGILWLVGGALWNLVKRHPAAAIATFLITIGAIQIILLVIMSLRGEEARPFPIYIPLKR